MIKIPSPRNRLTFLASDGASLLCGSNGFLELDVRFWVCERPVPGNPTVALAPSLPRFTVAPLPPKDTLEIPLVVRLTLTPLAIFMLFLNFIIALSPWFLTLRFAVTFLLRFCVTHNEHRECKSATEKLSSGGEAATVLQRLVIDFSFTNCDC
jgi:hypothetical protein